MASSDRGLLSLSRALEKVLAADSLILQCTLLSGLQTAQATAQWGTNCGNNGQVRCRPKVRAASADVFVAPSKHGNG